MSLIMNPTTQPLSDSLKPNDDKTETPKNVSARNKVLNNWNTSWHSIDIDVNSLAAPAITEQPNSRILKAIKSELKNSRPKTSIVVKDNSDSNGSIGSNDSNTTVHKSIEVVKSELELDLKFDLKTDLKPDRNSSVEPIEPTESKVEKRKPNRQKRPNEPTKKLLIKTSSLFKTPNPLDDIIRPSEPNSFNNGFNNSYQNSFHQFVNTKDGINGFDVSNHTKTKPFFNNYAPKPLSDAQLIAKKKMKRIRRTGLKFANGIKPKIKRNRIRPIVIKELLEPNSFLDFCTKKFPPIKEGVPFIQNRSCNDFIKEFESSEWNCCRDCTHNEKKNTTQTCRFFQYRFLIKNGDKLSVYGFAEENKATHDDTKIWLPKDPFNHSIRNLDDLTAQYLLSFVGQQFCQIYNYEEGVAKGSLSVTWKKAVKGIRELCDLCETTIFNTHYVCPKCGLAVCIDCFVNRRQLTNRQFIRKNRDQFGWLLCNERLVHNVSDLHLARFVTKGVFGSVNNAYHDIRNQKYIQGFCCDRLRPNLQMDFRQFCSKADIRELYPMVSRKLLCDDRLLLLEDPKCRDNLKLFQIYWLKGFPVMIQNINSSLNYELWSPQSFNFNFGRECSRLVDCMSGQILPRQTMKNFWDGFEDVDKRLKDLDNNEEMILKLKDWPPNAEFRDKLPRWFDDLMDALPLQEYTRYNGKRNLAARLPEFFVRPDLGPKMYCAYGSVLHPEKGTTNLHLDMSDAVNVMIYVGVAKKNNEPLEEHINEANNTLLKGGCDESMMRRANEAGRAVGALWHIWKAEDADKIRQFLYKVSEERHEKVELNNDPIHDQSWYLDQTLRTRLQNELGVQGVAIAQCLGDSILVPAGAPHQVQNIHSCIKVAGEFVSPENVAHCLTMTQQFRNLSKRHNNHEDKLQVKNIIYHTIKDCLSVLLPPYLIPQRPPSPVLMPPPLLPPINGVSTNKTISGYISVQTNETQTPTTSEPMETTVHPHDNCEEQSQPISSSDLENNVDLTLKTDINITESDVNSYVTQEVIEETNSLADSISDVNTMSTENLPNLMSSTHDDCPITPTDNSLAESLPPPPLLRPYYSGHTDDESDPKCESSKTDDHNGSDGESLGF